MKVANWPRLFFSIIYFTLSILIIILFHSKIFYLTPQETYNFFRFLWCISCSCLGFSILAFQLSITQPNPKFGPYISTIPSYITYYPFLLIMVSCLIFSIFNSIVATNGYIFYYATFGTCSIVGYFVDNCFQIIMKLLIERKLQD